MIFFVSEFLIHHAIFPSRYFSLQDWDYNYSVSFHLKHFLCPGKPLTYLKIGNFFLSFLKVFANEEDAKSFALGGDSKLKVNMAHPVVERVRR